MNLKSLIVTALFAFTTSAFAQYFPARAYVNVLPAQVGVQVFNPYNAPIICNGQAFGQTSIGTVHNAYFAEQLLVPGEYRYAYVYAPVVAPFINGWINIHCRFTQIW